MKYSFRAELWLWQGQGAWHFITLPKDISAEIKEAFGTGRPGFGSIRVTATIKDHIWKTSIFPDNSIPENFYTKNCPIGQFFV